MINYITRLYCLQHIVIGIIFFIPSQGRSGSFNEIGKERFLISLSCRVEEHGQEKFNHGKHPTGSVLNTLAMLP